MAFKRSGFYKHHHSGQIHRLVWKAGTDHPDVNPAGILWISMSVSPLMMGTDDDAGGQDGGAMLLAWAKMQLWEPFPAVTGDSRE